MHVTTTILLKIVCVFGTKNNNNFSHMYEPSFLSVQAN